jgi:glycosidase
VKFVIYQLFVRLFGNKTETNLPYGSIEKNGSGKFADITDKALNKLKLLGATHIWYTGVIEHSTTTDYSAFGILADHPCVVKGRAGSPYAIKDYYDVDPDLSVNPAERMREFEDLIKRTQSAGLKSIIDFVPNHLARKYYSDVKPLGTKDLGEDDDKSLSFSPQNNFYYLVGQSFQTPHEYETLVNRFIPPSMERHFEERPAKATGNDVFSPSPGINDWFETVKLNYGVDYANGRQKHFSPTPDVWLKMTDILMFWAEKGVDGFRCDMCEMVPTEFWQYAIAKVKSKFRDVIFIGEAYSPDNYSAYLSAGFDYLYDKVGLYDTLRAIIRGESDFRRLCDYRYSPVNGIETRMLAFLENHDEQRLASSSFAGNPFNAVPVMTVAALLGPGPVMIYNGQESGEEGGGAQGFGGGDGRTSIFDYGHMPKHLRWMNGGAFDGGASTEKERALFDFYRKLLNICLAERAIIEGKFIELQMANAQSEGFNQYKNYAFMRYTDKERLLVFVTVDTIAPDLWLKIPADEAQLAGIDADARYSISSLDLGQAFVFDENLTGADFSTSGLHIRGSGMSAVVLKIRMIQDFKNQEPRIKTLRSLD